MKIEMKNTWRMSVLVTLMAASVISCQQSGTPASSEGKKTEEPKSVTEKKTNDVPVIRAKAPKQRFHDWGDPPPPETNDGPGETWTWKHMMCDGPASFNVDASSILGPQGKHTYLPEHVCDDDPRTAWVEGAEGDGVGEYIEFNSWMPKGNGEIFILNGYQSGKTSWKNNGRVAMLMVSVNEKVVCMVELEDVMGIQSFTLPSKANKSLEQEDSVIRFTIMEVYPGEKWRDTAISGVFSCGG